MADGERSPIGGRGPERLQTLEAGAIAPGVERDVMNAVARADR